jgi:CheY-like chemotaxis protein
MKQAVVTTMGKHKAVIVCVDDEQNPLTLRKLVLQKAGYEVLTANSGKEALALVASRKVDLVLSDHLMPGMHGTELAEQLKAEHPNLPVILISGVNDLPAGSTIANAFVSKIEGPDALCKEVAAVLNLPLDTCEN